MKSIIIGATNDIKYGASLLDKHHIDFSVLDGSKNADGFKYSNNNVIIDISDETKVIEYIENNPIDFILPVPIGRFITTWGAINDHFNLKGISKESAILCTDKWLFHQKLNDNKLRNAYAFLITKDSLPLLNYEVTYPVIVKPRFGSGSRGVCQVDTKLELEKIVNSLDLNKDDYILETAVNGVEFGVDAVVFDNQFKMVLLREKKLTPLPNRQAVAYYSKYDEKKYVDLFSKVEVKLAKIIDVLKINNSLMHVDVMVNDDDIFVIELSARPSGHNLHNNFTIKATNYDMIEEYIKFQTNLEYSLEIKEIKNICIHYFDFENVKINKLPTAKQISEITGIQEYICNIKVDDIRGKIAQGSDLINDGYVILEGVDRDDIERKIETIKGFFDCEVIEHEA